MTARAYESLSHRFLLRCEDPELARRADELIGPFARRAESLGAGAGASAGQPIVFSLLTEADGDGQRHYVLKRDAQRVAASPTAGIVLTQLMWHISTDTVELAEGYLMVHAGTIVAPSGDGVVILGESGSGKTTLVAALVQDGYGYLSDEAAAIEMGSGLAHPWPRPLGFRRDSRSLPRFAPLFEGAIEERDETHLPIERIRSAAIAGPAQIRHVFDHRFRPGAQTKVQPLSRAVGLVRMGSAAPRLRREGARGLDVLAGVMRGARAYELSGGDLEQTVRTIKEQVGD